MKRELTLTDIAGYLPYGLKLLDRKYGMTTVWEWQSAACCDWNGEEKVEMISGEKYSEELVMASPILRPMSDLYVEITDKDCIKEGVYAGSQALEYPYYFIDTKQFLICDYKSPREAFAALIDKVSGRGTWDRNPWVVAYEFELVK